ncbi:uncharacterized protein LOC114308998 [Camellia sinensis]|uniref:uncharacterized protein LOC114308998 n=1 Tax=Camellia sinensis TaxID=4442 RepID=UPI0010359F51|nr:uncharacterized protein LOC114308998 [Camellia sinensis]
MKVLLPSIIDRVQSTFLNGRSIMDGVLIANEVVDWWKKSNRKGLILKLNFEKAYDTVNWNFLSHMLENFGFGSTWTKWMKGCISSARVSVLINGSPLPEFYPQNGLRRGDPGSPFLFNVVVEGLNILISRAKALGIFKGVSVGGSDVVVKEFAAKLHCSSQKLPLKYLGLPLGASPSRRVTWRPVVEKFKKKLSGWKRRVLSFAGRVTLIKSVLSTLPEDDALWKLVICEKYGSLGRRWFHVLDNVDILIGNGDRVSFWRDPWLGSTNFLSQFPRLFQLVEDKELSLSLPIARRSNQAGWAFNFRRALWAWEEDELVRLTTVLGDGPILRSESVDCLVWKSTQSGIFKWAMPSSIEGLLLWWLGWKFKKKVNQVWRALPAAILWSVWSVGFTIVTELLMSMFNFAAAVVYWVKIIVCKG